MIQHESQALRDDRVSARNDPHGKLDAVLYLCDGVQTHSNATKNGLCAAYVRVRTACQCLQEHGGWFAASHMHIELSILTRRIVFIVRVAFGYTTLLAV